MDKMHQTPDVPGTEPVTDNPNPGGTQGMDPTGPDTGPGGWKPKPGEAMVESNSTSGEPQRGGNVMTFRCLDAGMEGCRWEAAGRTEQDLRQQIERHGREAHGLKEIGESMWQRIREKIRERAA